LKNLALRAGLNCGSCVNKVGQSCGEHPVCDRWELHKFRKTFATLHHESGVSARTLQAWLGHSSLETTLAYLKVADVRSERTRAQVNNTFAQFAQPGAAAAPAVG
jgi:integrase